MNRWQIDAVALIRRFSGFTGAWLASSSAPLCDVLSVPCELSLIGQLDGQRLCYQVVAVYKVTFARLVLNWFDYSAVERCFQSQFDLIEWLPIKCWEFA